MVEVLFNDWAFGRQDLKGLLHRLRIDNPIDVNVVTASGSVDGTRRHWLVMMDDLNIRHDRRMVMDDRLLMVNDSWLLNDNWAVRLKDGRWRWRSVNADTSHSSSTVAVTAAAAARSRAAASTSSVMAMSSSRRI